MMNHAGFTKEVRVKMWCEAASTATKLNNILVKPEDNSPPYKKFYGKNPGYAAHLHTFGEIGVVADWTNKKGRSKITPRGKTCMFLGYPEDHSGNCFKFMNLITKEVMLSKDVQWLNKLWAEYMKVKYKCIESRVPHHKPHLMQ